jgi:hypothetical protein
VVEAEAATKLMELYLQAEPAVAEEVAEVLPQ